MSSSIAAVDLLAVAGLLVRRRRLERDQLPHAHGEPWTPISDRSRERSERGVDEPRGHVRREREAIVTNGLELGRETSPGPVAYGTSTSLFVGCHEAASQVTYYTGDIDDLYIFDHALTAAELVSIQ